MHGMGVQPVLAVVLLLFTATVKTDEGGVSFWKTNVTMTCPGPGKWFSEKDKTKQITENAESATADSSAGTDTEKSEFTFTYDSKGTYRCEYDSTESSNKKYYFHVEGKVCENCFELDAQLLALIIVVDVVVTALLMIMICNCTKNKSSARPAPSSKAPARSGGRPPPASSSDYEQLNRQTVSQGTYSVVNRTG